MNVDTLTEARFAKRQDRTAKQAGWGSTDAGLAIVERYLKQTIEILSSKATPREISKLKPEIIALVCLQVGISSVASEDTLSQTLYALGGAAWREMQGLHLADVANGSKERQAEIARITRSIIKRHGSVKYRKQAMRAAVQKVGVKFTEWPKQTLLRIGAWLLDVCLETPVFVRVTEPTDYISLTEEAHQHAEAIVERLLQARPSMLPLLEPPAPWKGLTTTIHGYQTALIRGRDRSRVSASIVRQAITDGSMKPVLDAINGAQNVAYRINHEIAAMVRWVYEHDVPVPGIPRKSKLDIPERPDSDDDRAIRVWRKQAADTYAANRAAECEAIQLFHDLKTAEFIGARPFWTPLNVDYRGRIYGVPHFNFQRQDHVRAMFLFDEGKPLDDDGYYWLRVHVANCGDFNKVSKQSYSARTIWVFKNAERIREMVFDPKANLWWTEADKPFMFLAACIELVKVWDNPGHVCRLPVSFDGSCSGLQHLAAMTRDENTASLVNLDDCDAPADVYGTVAKRVENAVREDAANGNIIAAKTLAHGVTRSLVKRNVMTYSYSSKRVGMANQHMEDTMKPLDFKVLCGELSEHPFQIPEDTVTLPNGVVLCRPGYHAARYLANRVYTAIEETIERPAHAMHFLQGLARALAHEEKPMIWRTPLGFPVVLRYPNHKITQITLWLHDRGVRFRWKPRAQDEAAGINKSKAAAAVAPSFVHSMDACHLHEVVRRANDEGINSIALVHDSFGCLPTDAARFRTIIKDAFYWLYTHDLLADVREQVIQQTQDKTRIPPLPAYGTYDISEIRNAEYAFA